MSLLRKFLILTFLPLLFTLPIIVFTRAELSNERNIDIAFFSIFLFTIISFNVVYVSNFFYQKGNGFFKTVFYSGLISFCSIFVFAFLWMLFFSKNDLRLKIILAQATLGFCVYLIEYLILFVLNKKSNSSIKFVDKNWRYLVLILTIILIEFLLFFLMTNVVLNNFRNFKDYLWDNRFMLAYMVMIPFFSFGFMKLSARYGANTIFTILFSSVFSTLITFFIISVLTFSTTKISLRYGPMLIIYLIGLFCTLFIYAYLYYQSQHKERIKLEYFVNQKDAQYLELKNQINPHFLFNNLNTLISFIESNPKKAIAFGHHLSNVYRHYLQKKDDDFVLLNEELEFIDEYLAIYKAKFEKGFNYKINNDRSNEHYLLSNCVQELIDNIFKHNISDNDNILDILIQVEGENLVIRNSVIKNRNAVVNGFGLDNMQKRYQYFTEKKIGIIEESGFFSVKLPLFKAE